VPADESPELLTATDGEIPNKSTSTKRRVLVIGVACLAVMATATYVMSGGRNASDLEPAPVNSARALLESPKMAETMKGNYEKLVPQLKAKDNQVLGQLEQKVQQSMKRITKHIKETDPKVFEQLNQLQLSESQQRGVLKVVGNMADDRMQKVGFEVARLAKDSKIHGKNTFSQEALTRKLEQSFNQNKTVLTDLRNEMIPAPLREMLDKSWDVSFDAEKMRLVRNSKDSWDVEFAVDKPSSRRLIDTSDQWGSSSTGSTDISQTAPGSTLTSSSFDGMGTKFEEGLGVLCGMLEQARVALDQIDFVGESFDVDMKIPYWAKSLIGGLDFVTELSDCVMRGESNEVKLMMCPMKYASAATDFLESVDNVMGINNGHFFGGATTLAPQVNFQQQAYVPQQGYVPAGSQQTWR
jgi:hypothetical protein